MDLLDAADRLSEVNWGSLASGDLTVEDLRLAAQIETLAAGFRLSALGTLQALGGEPGDAPGVDPAARR